MPEVRRTSEARVDASLFATWIALKRMAKPACCYAGWTPFGLAWLATGKGWMSELGRNAGGTGARLAARLAALNGVAPEPVCHIIFRSTRRIDGTQIAGYTVPDEPGPLDAEGLEAWLGRQPTS